MFRGIRNFPEVNSTHTNFKRYFLWSGWKNKTFLQNVEMEKYCYIYLWNWLDNWYLDASMKKTLSAWGVHHVQIEGERHVLKEQKYKKAY